MHPLLRALNEQVGDLVAVSDLTGELYVQVRRSVAACLVQANPHWPALVRGTHEDWLLEDIALEGVELASKWERTRLRVHWVREPYLESQTPTHEPYAVLGPFAGDDLSLVQVALFHTVDMFPVISRRRVPFATIDTTELLLPAGIVPHPERQGLWEIPAGSVWVRAERLSAGVDGYVALRISSGTLLTGGTPLSVSPLVLSTDSPWVLSVVPHPPEPHVGSTVGAQATVVLPERFEVRGDGSPPAVTGPLAMAGFGTDVRFERQEGPPVAEGDALGFPFDVGPSVWEAPHEGPSVLRFQAGDPVPVAGALWALPRITDLSEATAEVVHGGSLVLLLSGVPAFAVTGALGSCRCPTLQITADATGIQVRGVRPQSTLSIATQLWDDARSQVWVGEALHHIRYLSRDGGGELVRLEGGRVENQWDLPRASSGRPIPYAGDVAALILVAEPDGQWRLACQSAVPREPQSAMGFALENLYLHVWPPRRMSFVGSGAEVGRLSSGLARVTLDVRMAQPMLPDPYAASWRVSQLGRPLQPEGLVVVLGWSDGNRPTVKAFLADRVPMPEWTEDPWRETAEDARQEFRHEHSIDGAHLSLLDLSPRGHRLGVRLEPSERTPRLEDNQLTWPLDKARLLLEPQVHWEPVQIVGNPKTNERDERVSFRDNGGPTLVAATSVQLVPALPARVAPEIIRSAREEHQVGALFGLPFGLQAFTRLAPDIGAEPEVDLELHQDSMLDRAGEDYIAATTFLRLRATGVFADGPHDEARSMPGRLSQIENLVPDDSAASNNLRSVLRKEVRDMFETTFHARVPLHTADLSGSGLSTFSRWRRALPSPTTKAKEGTGITQVRFDVLVGRTSYEVIELQSRLWPPQARASRTVIVERSNAGQVQRYDSGWVAMEDGACQRYARTDTGVVREYRSIRNIRILDSAPIRFNHQGPSADAPREWEWQRVVFDADLWLVPDPEGQPEGVEAPIRDHVGFVQILPVDVATAGGSKDVDGDSVPDADVFKALMDAIGHPLGGPLDATVDLGGTLRMHLTHLEVAHAPGTSGDPRFVMAVSGAPTLPRAGQWTAVRIDGGTGDLTPVPPHRGVPVVRRHNETGFTFRDPEDVYLAQPGSFYGFLMATDAGRVLFPRPVVEPAERRLLRSAPPTVADPYALSQASGLFPRPEFALRCAEDAEFTIGAPDAWQLTRDQFTFSLPTAELARGPEWLVGRGFPEGRLVNLALDTLNTAEPWRIDLAQSDDLEVWIAGEHLLSIRSALSAPSGRAAALKNADVLLGPVLQEIRRLVNALEHFVDLGFDLDVDVEGGTGSTPSFVVHFRLQLRVPGKVHERVEIGIGKFMGQFRIEGRLEAVQSGAARGQLAIELYGDLQQGIIPPLLYAGGHFRFAAMIDANGESEIELGFGAIASLGGTLIPGLVELEATVRYGYTLIPKTLTPGVQLGIEARAKLLSGLLGISFSTDVLARVARFDVDDASITIWAELHTAATVQVAYLIEEDFDLRTQFVQEVPAEAFALVEGVNPLAVALASEIL